MICFICSTQAAYKINFHSTCYFYTSESQISYFPVQCWFTPLFVFTKLKKRITKLRFFEFQLTENLSTNTQNSSDVHPYVRKTEDLFVWNSYENVHILLRYAVGRTNTISKAVKFFMYFREKLSTEISASNCKHIFF